MAKEITIGSYRFNIEEAEHHEFWNYIQSGNWERETFDVLNQYISTDDVCLDIGAWAGPISLYMAKTAKYVVAIEPDPQIYPQLEANIALNKDIQPKITPIQKAIFSETGQMPLHARSKYGQSSSSLLHRSYDSLSTYTCETITLRDLCDELQLNKIDFIKVDIEGGEFYTLPKIHESLSELNHPSLLVSFHLNHLMQAEYYALFNSQLLSKIALKTGIFFQKSKVESIIRNALRGLKGYTFIYTDSGAIVSMDQLMDVPLSVSNQTLLFTNQEWKG
jgi:FkbM family methyltransferase